MYPAHRRRLGDDPDRRDRQRISAMAHQHEWNFFFGKCSFWKGSKAHELLQGLVTRYSEVRQSEKRLFAEKEVYDTIVKNGGRFLLCTNNEYDDVTEEEYTVNRIMQKLRDLKRVTKKPGRCTMQAIVDESVKDLPEDSQHSFNVNLSSRVERLERVLGSTRRENPPSQGTEAADNRKPFYRDSQQSINLDLHNRVKNLEGLIRAKKMFAGIEKGLNENREQPENSNETSRLYHSLHANDKGISESFDTAAGISDNV